MVVWSIGAHQDESWRRDEYFVARGLEFAGGWHQVEEIQEGWMLKMMVADGEQGDVIVRQGEQYQKLFQIVQGSCRIEKMENNEKKVYVSI